MNRFEVLELDVEPVGSMLCPDLGKVLSTIRACETLRYRPLVMPVVNVEDDGTTRVWFRVDWFEDAAARTAAKDRAHDLAEPPVEFLCSTCGAEAIGGARLDDGEGGNVQFCADHDPTLPDGGL